MGVVDDLAQARAAYERSDWTSALDVWSDIEPDEMSADDLHDAGVAAHLLGRRDASIDFHHRGFVQHQHAGTAAGAMRCCFHLAMIFSAGGEASLAHGWTARADRILPDLADDAVERGYLSVLHMHRHLAAGHLPAACRAAAHATAVGRDCGDPDLLALGLCSQGRLTIYSGRIADGLALLDEAMAGLAAGEVAPVVFGDVYCTAIEGCQEIGDLGRVGQWTSSLHRWCLAHPGLVAFTGQCSIHRGQLMRVHGAWPEALEEYAHAIERYRLAGSVAAVGLAECERGDVLRQRGELDAAEAAYERSSAHGYDPQPGLALLWLARGADDAALAAVRRLVGEASDPVARCRYLPAAVDVLVAAGALDEAQVVVAQLDDVASLVGTEALRAFAAFASGTVELAAGDAAGALPYLRKARRSWARARSLYEGARVRLATGRALTAVGDIESARKELEAACATFRELGATPSVDEAERLLRPAGHPAGLTGREVEVLRLVASGRSNAQIAAGLVLSEKTVARHLSNIFAKLHVGSRTAAAAYAFEHRLA
ncbi:LuxR family transcriptional regulator [Cellulomonas cellasea]|uniref:DNA-binding CsgD family transcriptional regulator n=1 Tax=Cellulomonas cellasea TaxID=43670 RepID=A0A7W4UFG2_9CELL|nr:LuxR family transcriptional regulator [Cellulomonas cellasea]MBB2923218.1 DNA-binding CsgD family transcriptional regulator [Cellulomonas cellasea]